MIFDADMLVFESASSVETPVNWGGDLWTLHANASDAEAQFEDRVSLIVDKVLNHMDYEGEYGLIMCFSDPKQNFRKEVLSTYKGNRAGKLKPVCYGAVRQWVEDRYDCVSYPTLEADDCVGLLADKYKGHEVHISGDKDFKTIPGIFFDFLHDEWFEISEEQAYKNFLAQVMIGDAADNYKGCPGIGPKTADKVLEKYGVVWKTVVDQFKKAGLSEGEALQQARVAHILNKEEEYDVCKYKVTLWNPN